MHFPLSIQEEKTAVWEIKATSLSGSVRIIVEGADRMNTESIRLDHITKKV